MTLRYEPYSFLSSIDSKMGSGCFYYFLPFLGLIITGGSASFLDIGLVDFDITPPLTFSGDFAIIEGLVGEAWVVAMVSFGLPLGDITGFAVFGLKTLAGILLIFT